MKKAILAGTGHTNNTIFESWEKKNNDNWFYQFWVLKEKFASSGVELNTPDIKCQSKACFELHMDVQKKFNLKIPKYVILYESPQVRPLNNNNFHIAKYHRVFTWRDDLVDGDRFIKINLPNMIVVNNSLGWSGRDKMFCLIAGNKSTPRRTSLDLYSERVKTIRWFEQNAPHEFDLFGSGWDQPPAKPGFANRIVRKLKIRFPRRESGVDFPSYRGKVVSKLETMQKYRFCICYENIRDLPGYITEKIWDCFFAGCVPVYWGALNITEYIPEDCFIDRRKYESHEELYKFIVSMTEAEFTAYQKRIAAFLSSEKSRPFSAEAFSETIVSTIVRDLEIEV